VCTPASSAASTRCFHDAFSGASMSVGQLPLTPRPVGAFLEHLGGRVVHAGERRAFEPAQAALDLVGGDVAAGLLRGRQQPRSLGRMWCAIQPSWSRAQMQAVTSW
jgi:hypothetical protein